MMARAGQITEAGGYLFFAGWRSEPFFFDANGAMNHLRFTPTIPSPTKMCSA